MMSSISNVGRVAVVTGANKGIGYFIALQLGMSGLFSHVILGCRDAIRGQQAIEGIQKQLSSSGASCSNVHVSYVPFVLGDANSHSSFCKHVGEKFGKIDVLVNNAAMAYKGADPTPFKEQCKPTLDVNFRGTVDFTEEALPLIRKGTDPRIVNVASMAGRLSQISSPLQQKFASEDLTIEGLRALVDEFENDVTKGQHKAKGWGNSNYGMSKLALIAATKVWAREEKGISVNAICPGYCKTDMTSQKGSRSAMDGARNAVIPATMEQPPTGEFYKNYEISQW